MQLNEYFVRSLGNSGNDPRHRSECRAANEHLSDNEGMLRQLPHDITTHTEENRMMGNEKFQKAVDFKEQETVTETDEGVSLDNSESFLQNKESTIVRVPAGSKATNTHNNSLLCQKLDRVT